MTAAVLSKEMSKATSKETANAMANVTASAMSGAMANAMTSFLSSAMTDALRARPRRQAAALALASDPRRAQLGWDDLAAWPDWAALEPDALHALQRDCGLWLHTADWQRCICGARLKQVQHRLGDAAFAWLMALPQASCIPANATPVSVLPDPAHLDAWLLDEGREVLLASVGSASLRVVLRERLWPRSLPPLPARDTARAQQALVTAQVAARASAALRAQAVAPASTSKTARPA